MNEYTNISPDTIEEDLSKVQNTFKGVKELKKAGFYRATEKTLNSILKRLNKV